MACQQCSELFETPIFLELMEEMFGATTEVIISDYHKKKHNLWKGNKK